MLFDSLEYDNINVGQFCLVSSMSDSWVMILLAAQTGCEIQVCNSAVLGLIS